MKKRILSPVFCVLGLAVLGLAALCLGQYSLSPAKVLAAFWPGGWPGVSLSDTDLIVIFNVRLPRVLLALLAGAALSGAGAAFQAVFSNPLATPDTLGVATGASFGAVLAILMGLPALAVQGAALAMGLGAVALVYLVGQVRGERTVLTLVLAGLVVSSLFSALVSLVKYVADPQNTLPAITFWLMGSLSGTTRRSLALGLPFLGVGVAVLWLLRWKLNLLALPQEEALSLGVPVKKLRVLAVGAAALITASVVSLCGQIGWVGLLVPHAARMLVGGDNRRLIPASFGLGAAFFLVIDTLARCATAAEIPVSILTAVVGAPLFIVLLRRTGGAGL